MSYHLFYIFRPFEYLGWRPSLLEAKKNEKDARCNYYQLYYTFLPLDNYFCYLVVSNSDDLQPTNDGLQPILYYFISPVFNFFPQTVYCWGSILETKELATLTGRTPELCGWALWLGSVAGLCVQALSSSCPCLCRAPELCGPAYWRGVWPNK